MWLDFPSVGGPSPDVPLMLTGERLEYFREHTSLVPNRQLPWVFASGVRGARHMRLRLASREEAGDTKATYEVRLYWRDVAVADLSSPGIDIRLQGQSPGGDCHVLSGPDTLGGGVIQQWHTVRVGEFLDLDITTTASPDPQSPARCCVGSRCAVGERGTMRVFSFQFSVVQFSVFSGGVFGGSVFSGSVFSFQWFSGSVVQFLVVGCSIGWFAAADTIVTRHDLSQ